jgi:hypothetical protein
MSLQSKLAYLAGFFDGEGSFSICRTRSTVRTMADGSIKKYIVYKLDVSLTNTNREVLDWIVSNFGGAVYASKQESRKSTYLPRYSWRCNNNEERERFILGVLPYLKVKKPMAEIALEFIRMYKQEGEFEKRQELRNRLQVLNHSYRLRSESVETIREAPEKDDDIVRTAQ